MEIVNNSKKIFYWILVIIFLFVCFFSYTWRFRLLFEVRPPNEIQFVKIAGQTIKVELALTQKTQEKGLSGRESLKENEGMLFVFEKPNKYFFWMKDMNFSIDIIWLDENLNVIYVKKNVEPKSFPETFGSNKNSKYVLEINANFSEKNNLKEGDSVQFLP